MERLSLDSTSWLQWADALTPPVLLADARNRAKARLLVIFYMATAVFLLSFTLLYWLIDYRLGFASTLYGAAVVPLLLYVFYKTGSFTVTSGTFNVNALLMFTMLIYGSGGIDSCILPWLAIVPATGFVFDGWWRGLLMTLVGLAEIIVLYALEVGGIELPTLFDPQHARVLNLSVLIGLMVYITMVLMFYQITRERTIVRLDRLYQDLNLRKQEVEQQREELAERNARIADTNAQLEQLVALRTARLARAKRELDTFLYEAAHALRRPVARIMGLSGILRGQAGDAPAALALHDHMDTSTTLMDQILHKLILVNEVDNRVPQAEPLEMGALLAASLGQRAAEVDAAGAVATLSPAPPQHLEGDAFLIDLAFGLVLENALRYTARSGRPPEIGITVDGGPDHVQFSIQDNGIGIAASELPRVTEMFFRATEKVAGGGLGLYVVRRALERIGGSLHVESELGQWTRVTLRVPRKPSLAADAESAFPSVS